jgi:hypothetical protein
LSISFLLTLSVGVCAPLAPVSSLNSLSAGIAFYRKTVHDAEMKTLWLRTVNEDPVYTDSNGKATLDSTSGPCIEAREGEHSDAKIEAIRKAASELLGVNCVWVEEGEGADEILGQPGKPPPI